MGLACESVTEAFVVICQRVLLLGPFSLPPRLDFYEWWLLTHPHPHRSKCLHRPRENFLKDLQFPSGTANSAKPQCRHNSLASQRHMFLGFRKRVSRPCSCRLPPIPSNEGILSEHGPFASFQ